MLLTQNRPTSDRVTLLCQEISNFALLAVPPSTLQRVSGQLTAAVRRVAAGVLDDDVAGLVRWSTMVRHDVADRAPRTGTWPSVPLHGVAEFDMIAEVHSLCAAGPDGPDALRAACASYLLDADIVELWRAAARHALHR